MANFVKLKINRIFYCCLFSIEETQYNAPSVDAIAIDGPGFVHMNTHVKTVDTFGDYCNHQIADKLLSLSQNVSRIDVYRVLSLKQETRESRGADGMRISLQKETPIQHKMFGKVLKVDENKTALFNMIADWGGGGGGGESR